MWDLIEARSNQEENSLKEPAFTEAVNFYQKRYEEAQKAKILYRSLLDSSADAIIIYDLEGRAVYVNPTFTRVFGWSLEEVARKRIPFLPESEYDATMAAIEKLVTEKTPCAGFETKRFTKDGRLLDVSISASCYSDHRNRSCGILVIMRDITDRKQLEAQLLHAQRMEAIGILASGIAHDFNNIMMGISGNVSLILHDLDHAHPYHYLLNNVEELIRSASKLTRQLLGYARKGSFDPAPLDLNEIVRNCMKLYRPTCLQIKTGYQLSKNLPHVIGDATQLEQVFFNLFINAADAMPDGGVLTVETKRVAIYQETFRQKGLKPGHYVLVKVSDDGMGMDTDTMAQIFEPFFTTKSKGLGTGLGLASTYGIIKGHGGYIYAESANGAGTAFSIYLPPAE